VLLLLLDDDDQSTNVYLIEVVKRADIVVAAVGRAEMVC
jgi:5,10-methylene-tetrahydrofolate dehydrogenase/methenyl tetrahydrofolate cyclohydrolase